MKTDIAYYNDGYQKEIQTKVTECIKSKKGYDVVLEDTCFYPEGGGQPADRGKLNGQEVLDVQEENGIIYHTVKNKIEVGTVVKGEIDWEYRFDLMQNHTAEHIFSGLVYREYGFHNVGFHMGKEFMTLDFDGKLSKNDVLKLEIFTNKAVMKNREIKVYYPTKEELEKLDYRSKKKLEGIVRIVEIPEFDICACCGIHVKFTGEIGCVKILSYEPYKGGTRIRMVAGERALFDYYNKSVEAQNISHMLSVPVKDISKAVAKLKKERDTLQYQLNLLEKQKLEKIVETVEQGSKKVVLFEKVSNSKTLQHFANLLCQKADVAAVFSGDDKIGYTYVLISQKEDMKELRQKLSAALQCNGGGTKEMIQGKIQSSKKEIEAFFKNYE